MPDEPDPEFMEWLDAKANTLSAAAYELAEGILKNGDDRVTILGMIQSAVMHGLHDAGFTDETA